jgi:hypothetical protein
MCVILLIGLPSTGCNQERLADSAFKLCGNISNEGIEWVGDFIGMRPTLVGENEQLVETTHVNVDSWLMQALDDPNRWIAAHVLLTARHPECGTRFDTSHWNGLEVRVRGDGPARIDPKQQDAIREFWRKRLAK